jgi:hypothetical protein
VVKPLQLGDGRQALHSAVYVGAALPARLGGLRDGLVVVVS